MLEKIPTSKEVAAAERTYTPGEVPEEVWVEHLRLNACVTVEIIPYRIIDGKVEIFMTRRPKDDRFYSNEFHTPGTMCNGKDYVLNTAIQRVKREEMPGFEADEPEEIDILYRRSPRGVEAAFVYLMKILEGGSEENWHDAENLPKDTISQHLEMIKTAVEKIKLKGPGDLESL